MAKRVGTPIYTAAPGYGSSRVAATMGALFGVPLLVTPVIVAAVLTAGAPLAIRAPVLAVCGAAYGLGLASAGVRIAAATGEGKMPELCQVALASQISPAQHAHRRTGGPVRRCSASRLLAVQEARILAFWLSNSWAVMTPRSRRSASLASCSAGLLPSPAACWT